MDWNVFWTAFFTALAAALPALLVATATFLKQRQLGHEMNDMKDKLVTTTAKASHAEGKAEGKAEGLTLKGAGPVFVKANSEGTILDASQSILGLLGWRSVELVGKNIDILVAPEYAARHHAALTKYQQTGVLRPDDMVVKGRAVHRNQSLVPVIVSVTKDGDNLMAELTPWAEVPVID